MVYAHLYRTEGSETKTTNSQYGEYYIKGKKIPCQPLLIHILQYVDSNRDQFLKNLSDLIEIPSINGDFKNCNKAIDLVEKWLKKLEMQYEIFNIGYKKTADGKKISYPRVVLAFLGNDPKKKTICIYTHLDVLKPESEKWSTDPFNLTKDGKKVIGCGVASGKSVLLCWFHMIEAFQEENIDIPVNLTFIIESNHYNTSEGLHDFISSKKQELFQNIDHVVISQFEWIGKKKPCIIYGTVGVLHYMLTAEKVDDASNTDPKKDIEDICKKLTDEKGEIIIDNYNQLVQQITPEEEKMYEAITDFDFEKLRENLPPHQQNWSKEKLLMHFWRLPSLWMDEIKGCTCPEEKKTIFKRHLIFKIVPSQIIQLSEEKILNYIEKVKKELNISSKIDCHRFLTTRFWLGDVNAPQYEAAKRAIIQIYKDEPNMCREDSCSRIVTILDLVFEKTILILPIFPRDSNSGGVNENIIEKNFYETTKVFAAYILQLALIK